MYHPGIPGALAKEVFLYFSVHVQTFSDNTIRHTYLYMGSLNLYMQLPCWSVIASVFSQTSDLSVPEIYLLK